MLHLLSVSLLAGLLGICAFYDIRNHLVPVGLIFLGGIIGLVLYVLQYVDDRTTFGIGSLLGGMAFGGIFCLLSKITKEKIGIGDGVLLVTSGIFLGFYQNMCMTLYAFFLVAFYSAILLLVKKVNSKTELPFVPFLFLTFSGMILSGGVIV